MPGKKKDDQQAAAGTTQTPTPEESPPSASTPNSADAMVERCKTASLWQQVGRSHADALGHVEFHDEV